MRADAIIPMGPVLDYVGQKTDQGFTLKLFLDGGAASFSLYDDDGVSFEYEKGKYSIHHLSADLSAGKLSIETPPELRIDAVEAHVPGKPAQLLLNGKRIPFKWESRAKELLASIKP